MLEKIEFISNKIVSLSLKSLQVLLGARKQNMSCIFVQLTGSCWNFFYFFEHLHIYYPTLRSSHLCLLPQWWWQQASKVLWWLTRATRLTYWGSMHPTFYKTAAVSTLIHTSLEERPSKKKHPDSKSPKAICRDRSHRLTLLFLGCWTQWLATSPFRVPHSSQVCHTG